ncbi:MAG: type II toxin-antitoxin system VapC family toxin [Thermoleophilaceae bacterium]
MRRVYVDANVFLYAVGHDSPYRDPARRVIGALADQTVAAETSVLTLQEVVNHRRRRGDRRPAGRGREIDRLCTVRPATRELLLAALDLVDGHPHLIPADAVHAATALAHGVGTIITGDDDFDRFPDLRRVDLLDGASMAAVLGN